MLLIFDHYGFTDERRKYSAVKVEMEQKNLSVEGNNRKKRQRKKKKCVKSNLEETVQGSNRSGLVKDCDVTCNDALKRNVTKGKGDMWKSNKTCEVAVPNGGVHKSKDTAKGNRDHRKDKDSFYHLMSQSDCLICHC